MLIGKRLKSARYQKNYTQEYMAEILNVSQKTYSNFENDKSSPDLKQLDIIAKELDVDLLELLKFEAISITNNGGTNQQAMIMNNTAEKLIEQYEMRIADLKTQIESLKFTIEKLLEK